MTRVKICGITNLDDALAATEFGADLIGFNFVEQSPRYITPKIGEEIASRLNGHVTKVGVFVNARVETILSVVEQLGLNGVQLHGDEDARMLDRLKERSAVRIIKALRVSVPFDATRVAEFASADAILLDAYSRDQYGGTGKRFDWEVAGQVKAVVEQLILAGGLDPENVADAVAEVQPYAVDVASGVEISPGRKDRAKMKTFIERAKSA